jgi:hypothetical protein
LAERPGARGAAGTNQQIRLARWYQHFPFRIPAEHTTNVIFLCIVVIYDNHESNYIEDMY